MIRPSRSWVRGAGLLAMVVAPLAGCGGPFVPPSIQPGDDPFEVIRVAVYGSVDPATRSQVPLPASAHKRRPFWRVVTAPPDTLPPRNPIDLDLLALLTVPPGSARETVVVTLVDTTHLRRLPRFPASVSQFVPRTDTDGDSLLRVSRDSILALQSRQVPQSIADSTMLAGFDAHVLEHYWLSRSLLVTIRRDSVISLSHHPEVIDIRLDRGNPPPQVNDKVIHGRDAINTDMYLDLGLGYSWTALLDTGVRTTHCLLCSQAQGIVTTRLCKVADCTQGECEPALSGVYVGCSSMPKCLASTGDVDGEGHGTSSAAILTGGDYLGPRFRGATQVSLDCFRVFKSDNLAHYGPLKKGLQLALARRNKVIAIQVQENPNGVWYLDADKAYDDGSMVLVAAGNNPNWKAADPAKGRKVLAIGTYKVQNREPESHAHGVISGRVKPDLLAPTWTETAANTGDFSTHAFSGTSGATPFAAAAALLLHDWITLGQTDVDPGQVYAHLILSGNAVGPFGAATPYGAGRLRLPRMGQSRSGKTAVNGQFPKVEIPVEIRTSDVDTLEAAIWWPEESVFAGNLEINTHSDLNLAVIAPPALGLLPGSVKAASDGPDGVYERTRVAGSPLQTGTWKLRIEAKTLRNGPQIVYWAVRLKKHGDPY